VAELMKVLQSVSYSIGEAYGHEIESRHGFGRGEENRGNTGHVPESILAKRMDSTCA
jgi:hypothetical protein